MNRVSLGIDTSNYKTSVAVTDENGHIICNLQRLLDVKKGERGLRQSVALFQHVNRLPELLEEAFSNISEDMVLDCVAVSSRPRPVEGSYMPVFNAGVSAARTIAAARDIPMYSFSHQEGHVKAASFYTPLRDAGRFLAFHFSGGTTEGLLVDGDSITIEGGSRDLAFGQVLDRVGVAMGLAFPCGQALDQTASEYLETHSIPPGGNLLPKIRSTDGYINLSGIESCCQRMVAKGEIENTQLVCMLFERICQAMADQCRQLCETLETKDILFAGGVSSSTYIRSRLPEKLPGIRCSFASPGLSCDNAVGIALLGGEMKWR